mmetsp:Transcript_140350/g.364856  ORF Transcript_140350/g.364856 Transcript_140350/m.364856 type:complete len:202 (-) Transcript_140350:494-1099(-)
MTHPAFRHLICALARGLIAIAPQALLREHAPTAVERHYLLFEQGAVVSTGTLLSTPVRRMPVPNWCANGAIPAKVPGLHVGVRLRRVHCAFSPLWESTLLLPRLLTADALRWEEIQLCHAGTDLLLHRGLILHDGHRQHLWAEELQWCVCSRQAAEHRSHESAHLVLWCGARHAQARLSLIAPEPQAPMLRAIDLAQGRGQ